MLVYFPVILQLCSPRKAPYSFQGKYWVPGSVKEYRGTSVNRIYPVVLFSVNIHVNIL